MQNWQMKPILLVKVNDHIFLWDLTGNGVASASLNGAGTKGNGKTILCKILNKNHHSFLIQIENVLFLKNHCPNPTVGGIAEVSYQLCINIYITYAFHNFLQTVLVTPSWHLTLHVYFCQANLCLSLQLTAFTGRPGSNSISIPICCLCTDVR